MRRWIVLSLLFALAGCIGTPRPVADIARYDFGAPAGPDSPATHFPLHDVKVIAPSWLDTPLLQYRLLFADATRRWSYAESRWVAPPSELLEATLRRYLVDGGGAAAKNGCNLRVDLDELAQVFHTPQRSEGLITLQVSLVAPRRNSVLAHNGFTVAVPAATADARGGVNAISQAATTIGQRLQDWLNGLDRGEAAGLNIAQVCSGA